MLIYAKEINDYGLCNIGFGTDEQYYIDNGYTIQDVTFNQFDSGYYLTEKFETFINQNPHKLQEAKNIKLRENQNNLKKKRYGQTFTVIIQDQECVFDTSEETQRDLQTAALVTSSGLTYDGWVTNNDITLNLTNQDVQTVFSAFYQLVSPLYQKDLEYKTSIENAQTIKDLENITLIY